MSSSQEVTRRTSFGEHWPTWIVVHHLLSASLVRELLEAAVSVASGGRFELGDLVDEKAAGDGSDLDMWALRLKPLENKFGRHLQEFVRAIVWQGDASYPLDPDWPEPDRSAIQLIAAAELVSSTDLSHGLQLTELPGSPPQLGPFLECLRSTRELTSTPASQADTALALCQRHFPDAPLRALVIKHLGDLLVDAESWVSAETFYVAAAACADAIPDGPWHELRACLSEAVSLSIAAVRRAVKGPAEALELLRKIERQARQEGSWTGMANVAEDLMEASFSTDAFEKAGDIRVAVLFSPTIATEHHLSRALENWHERRYDDAYRWFWAVLRRQIALGALRTARYTKSLYGRCLIEGAHASFERMREMKSIRLGIRMLIESGAPKSAEYVEWSDNVVASAIDRSMIEFALSRTTIAPGYEAQRVSVLLILMTKWAEKLQVEGEETARYIISTISNFARSEQTSLFSNKEVRGDALKALLKIAHSNPEYCKLAPAEVISAAFDGLRDGSPISQSDALKVADEYADAIEIDRLLDFTEATIALLAANPFGNIVTGPAISYLHGFYHRPDAARYTVLRERIAKALLDVTAANPTQASYLAVLKGLDPTHANELSDPSRVQSVVATIRENAMATNSSAAASNADALLRAARLVGWDAVESALVSLHQIVSSAVNGRTAPSFSAAYRPLMSFASQSTSLVELYPKERDQLSEHYESIVDSLLLMWRKARNEPLIFSGFAIPRPTAPNQTIVHNWTFASLFFSRGGNRESEMREAIASAAENPELKEAIAVALAVEATGDTINSTSVENPELQTRGAFYAALGRKLIATAEMPEDARHEPVKVMIEQCYRMGPKGEDAAVFLMARSLGIATGLTSEATTYARKLENDKSLRLSLGPLFASLTKQGGS